MSPQLADLYHDELELLERLVPLDGVELLEAGCGNARLARTLLQRHHDSMLIGVEVDDRQLAKNLALPQERLQFLRAGAEDLPFPDASFDGALMLKSLHHVPLACMDQAFDELGRVVRPGGWLYVSEPVYAGALNEIVRLYNDEGLVRAAAQRALDAALSRGAWEAEAEHRFEMPVHFKDFGDFEQRMMRPTFADHQIDAPLLARVSQSYSPHQGPQGASFTRPMHARLLRRRR